MDTKLRRTIAETLGVEESVVSASTSAENESSWDSLRHINLVFALEDAFDVRFSDDEIPNLTSVQAIIDALTHRGAAIS